MKERHREELLMNLVIGADKGGYAIKNALIPYLEEKGHHVIDVGTTDPGNPRSHNNTGIAAAEAIRNGSAEKGILICGTGMGMSIAANKNEGIYAACVESVYAAKYCRLINDANILCFGGFIVGESMAKEMVDAFLETEFLKDFPQWRIDYLTAQKQVLQDHERKVFNTGCYEAEK